MHLSSHKGIAITIRHPFRGSAESLLTGGIHDCLRDLRRGGAEAPQSIPPWRNCARAHGSFSCQTSSVRSWHPPEASNFVASLNSRLRSFVKADLLQDFDRFPKADDTWFPLQSLPFPETRHSSRHLLLSGVLHPDQGFRSPLRSKMRFRYVAHRSGSDIQFRRQVQFQPVPDIFRMLY